MLSLDPSKKFHFGSHQEFYNKAVLSTVIKLYSNNKVRYSLLIKCFNFQAGCKSLAWWILRTGVLKLLGAREPLQVVKFSKHLPIILMLIEVWCFVMRCCFIPDKAKLEATVILSHFSCLGFCNTCNT